MTAHLYDQYEGCWHPEQCPHRPVPRCPACGREHYGPAVWAVTHGIAVCRCGHVVSPEPAGHTGDAEL